MNRNERQAFPGQFDRVESGKRVRTDIPGMTIREHFAGLAMQGLLASGFDREMGPRTEYGVAGAARVARQAADALLAEMEKGG